MILVIGSGVAGLVCAIEAARGGAEVLLVTPGTLRESGASAEAGGNTALAQGGIAAAIGADDSPLSHAEDTVLAGAGLVDRVAANVLTSQGAVSVEQLLGQGFQVDRDASGAVSFGLEAAHRRARIVHAGEDRTGAALHNFLSGQLLRLVAEDRVQLAERTSVVSLLGDAGAVTGAVLRDESGALSSVHAAAVVLATGGYGALYSETSNHSGASGQGIVLAARLGAVVADLEFVQFHPTVLAGTGFLISEVVRGAGALLLDERGKRFMVDAHEAAELAPRDVVSRHAHRSMSQSGTTQVWLDARVIERAGGPGTLERRFPALTAAVRARGIDWRLDPVPVAPAAHYTMGGIVTDLFGRTSLPGLFAVGEVACTGVHGANRLASNSLLEGLVFGERAAAAAGVYTGVVTDTDTDSRGKPLLSQGQWELAGCEARNLVARAGQMTHQDGSSDPHDASSEEFCSEPELARALSVGLGIERTADGISEVARLAAGCSGDTALLIGMIAEAAAARTESRGAHQRADFPETDPAAAERRAWLPGSSTRSSGPVPATQPMRSELIC